MAEMITIEEENVAEAVKNVADKVMNSKEQNMVDLQELPERIRHFYEQYKTETLIAGAVLAFLWFK